MFGLFKNKIVINGKSFETSGTHIEVNNNRVFVDGKEVCGVLPTETKIVIYGDVSTLSCTGSVEVNGECGSVDCGGNCCVHGNVTGDIDAGGSVTCKVCTGDIDAGGSVRCNRF